MLLANAYPNIEDCNFLLYAPNGLVGDPSGATGLIPLFPKLLAGENSIELDSLVLTSSTEGSTKKFRITVDDTGALTATEVTS